MTTEIASSVAHGWEVLIVDGQRVKVLAPLACKTDKESDPFDADRVRTPVHGRKLLQTLDIPEPWHGHVEASLQLIDDLDRRISEIDNELKRSGADHRYVPLPMTAPGIEWIIRFTIATQIGDIGRFSSLDNKPSFIENDLGNVAALRADYRNHERSRHHGPETGPTRLPC